MVKQQVESQISKLALPALNAAASPATGGDSTAAALAPFPSHVRPAARPASRRGPRPLRRQAVHRAGRLHLVVGGPHRAHWYAQHTRLIRHYQQALRSCTHNLYRSRLQTAEAKNALRAELELELSAAADESVVETIRKSFSARERGIEHTIDSKVSETMHSNRHKTSNTTAHDKHTVLSLACAGPPVLGHDRR